MKFDKDKLLKALDTLDERYDPHISAIQGRVIKALIDEVDRLREIVEPPIKTCPKCAGLGCVSDENDQPGVSLSIKGMGPCPVCHGSRVVNA